MTNQKGGTNTTKDVIYIDVDDEITGVIDKLQGSDKKIIALVLPKRATVLQSIVNMKLLKRAATEAKKNLVLITSEGGLMPLAGSVGIHVAKSLNTKPEIPDNPAPGGAKADIIEDVEEDDGPVDASKSVGELSGGAPADDAEDTIELDDEEEGEPEPAVEGGKKVKKHRKFKIPNFNKFRVMLALAGVAIILLGVLGYAAAAVWPAAKITIKTDSSAVSSSVILTLKTEPDTKLDAAQGIVPATLQDVKKTITQDAPATGQKNNGQKAAGTVTLSLTDCSKNSVTVPAGTGISSGGKT
ncbi:MAG TPA: hypothetical protein VL737_00500, partial [Candidatus Pristimantibacillus sp.]|nr:hypothetical protein [Candidatus Pristimantibacillus sp.]